MRSWQILKIWGIPFKIHSNWLVLFFLFSWSITNQVILTSSEIYNIRESWVIGLLTSLCLLASIIFHQIFHTLVCLREGVKIKKITFFFLGAVLQIEKDCQNALGNIKISLVRPIFYLMTSLFLLSISVTSQSKDLILINVISRVSIFNLLLGFFNLIPIGSLDGGNLFKSLVWHFTGSKNKGRLFLNKLTFAISIFALIVGIFGLLNLNFYYGLLVFLFGIFGINASKSESQYLQIEKILKETDVSNLNLKPLRRIEIDLTIKEFNKFNLRNIENSDKYFFITNNGRWDGFFTKDNLKNISIKKWDKVCVGDYKKPINDFPSGCNNEPLWKLIEKLEKTNEGILLILNPLGIPMGLIDRNKVGFYILKKLGIDISIEIMKKIKSKSKYPLGLELPKMIQLMKSKGDI